jgi:ribonuclease HI
MENVLRWLAETARRRGGDSLYRSRRRTTQVCTLASNNVVEHEALVHGLSITISLGMKRLMVYNDSLVVISQVNKD